MAIVPAGAYRFTAKVFDFARVQYSEAVVTWANEVMLDVTIDATHHGIVNVEDEIALVAHTAAFFNLQYRWTLESANGRQVIGEEDSLLIRPGDALLSPGQTYTIALNVSRADQSGSASLTLTTNEPPRGGSITATTLTVLTGQLTAFELRTRDWEDVDAPLKYSFGTTRNGLDEPISGAALSNTVAATLLPAGLSENMTVYVRACDTRGACARATTSVEVTMPNLSPLNITRGMDVAAGVLDITGFVGAAKAVFRPLSHNAGGRRLQGTDASALLRQVLEEAQMFADVFVPEYLDVVRWATLFRDVIVHLNNEYPDPQQSEFDELHGLAAGNLAVAERLGIDPIGAEAFVHYAAELSSVTLHNCDSEWAAAASRAVTAFLRSVAKGQMHYGSGPFAVRVAGLQTLVLAYDGVAAPALALEPQPDRQVGAHASIDWITFKRQCTSTLVDCQLPDGATILMSQWDSAELLACADPTALDEPQSSVLGFAVLVGDVVIGRSAEHREPIITVHVPWLVPEIAPGSALSCLTFQGSGLWSDEECSVLRVDATEVQCACTQFPVQVVVRTTASSCDAYSDCGACLSHPSCGWCASTNRCTEGNSVQSFDLSECPDWHHRPEGVYAIQGQATACPCPRTSQGEECGGPYRGACDAAIGTCSCRITHDLLPDCSETDNCINGVDTEYIDPYPCKNDGACSDVPGENFLCACSAGWTGRTCEDVDDPCTSDSSCGTNAECVVTHPGVSGCRCRDGFQGDPSS